MYEAIAVLRCERPGANWPEENEVDKQGSSFPSRLTLSLPPTSPPSPLPPPKIERPWHVSRAIRSAGHPRGRWFYFWSQCAQDEVIEELVSERDLFLRRLWIFAGFMIGQFGQIVIMDLLRNRMCRINEDIFEQTSFCLRDVCEPPTHRCPLGKWVL